MSLSQNNPSVAVVILNWNGKSFLEKFLPSVIKNSGNARIIVADNDSKDSSVDFMKASFPDVELLINDSNGGYAKGYNDALKQIKADYYVLLNSDIEVTAGWVDSVISLMESDKNIAACQPKLRAYYAQDEFEYAGGSGGFIDRWGYPFCRGRIFSSMEKDNGQYDDIEEVFWATGAAMFVRSNSFWQVGGLDEDFFAHMEEIDLCWRLKNAGYKIMVQPASVVFHVGGGTLPKNSPRKTYLNFRNNFYLLYKNLPKKDFYTVFFFRLLWDGVAGLKFLLEGHWRDTLAVIKAHFHFYINLRRSFKKREKIAQHSVSMIYKKNIVLQHFVFRVKKFSSLNKNDFTTN
jgi:GT2 family glycosyltransferase